MKTLKRAALVFLTLAALFSCGREYKPLIGISSSRTSSGSSLVSETYIHAVRLAGGIPVLLPQTRDSLAAEELITRCDGIIFSGGEDIAPARYGEKVWNGTVEVDSLRDVSDLLLARTAVRLRKPVFGICRGAQLMNVVLGGTLYQDLPSQVGTVHSDTTHRILVKGGSFLSRLMKKDTLTVNSYHHQAVKDPAPGVCISARAEDGVVEAFEADGVMAVQFHPEKAIKKGDTSWLPLFQEFIRRARH